jgi:hypothetical protein
MGLLLVKTTFMHFLCIALRTSTKAKLSQNFCRSIVIPLLVRWAVVVVSGRRAEYLVLERAAAWKQLPDLLTEHSDTPSVGMTGSRLIVAGGFSRSTHFLSILALVLLDLSHQQK